MDGQDLEIYGYYLISRDFVVRVQPVNILFEVGGEEEKGKASHYLIPQLAVANDMNIIKTRYSIFNEKKPGLNSLFWLLPHFPIKILSNYVIRMISNT